MGVRWGEGSTWLNLQSLYSVHARLAIFIFVLFKWLLQYAPQSTTEEKSDIARCDLQVKLNHPLAKAYVILQKRREPRPGSGTQGTRQKQHAAQRARLPMCTSEHMHSPQGLHSTWVCLTSKEFSPTVWWDGKKGWVLRRKLPSSPPGWNIWTRTF